jgi:FKBP-type peptidyl-prolyl cis-trans isomerase 2
MSPSMPITRWARQALHFEVEVVDVREGTPQEIELGHVHAGGEDH